MRGWKERREVYSEIDLRSTQRFGAICSPFQALQLTVSGPVLWSVQVHTERMYVCTSVDAVTEWM